MRAWVVERHGPPAEVLRLTEVDAPSPGAGEVVVAVEAAALNFADALACEGTYQDTPPLPFTPGLEVAGTVVAAGAGVDLPVGARVVGAPAAPTGGLAERCVARAREVFPLPGEVGAVEAAAMHVAYQTAWFALVRRAAIAPGEVLVVHAGAGGVGSAAVALGRALGARVIATAGGPDKVARCRELGADLAFDHRADDVRAGVLDATGGRGADVIFDPVGGDMFTASTRYVAWEGRIVVVGAASGRYAEARTNHVLVKDYAVVGLNWGGYRARRPDLVARAHQEVMALRLAGQLPALAAEVVPLAGAADALVRLVSGRTTGKVVVGPTR